MAVKVQLYGGGIDSVCIARLWEPDVKVYFNIGTAESALESAVARAAGCVIDDRLFLGDQVLPNKILPARNLLLVTLASYYGNHIILGSTAGDTTRDKDQRFCDLAQDTLTHILAHDPEKALPFHTHGITVVAPALRLTKTQLVEQYLLNGGDQTALLESRSCYAAGERECGECRSCTRKYVALRLNGIACEAIFSTKPNLEEALAYAYERGRGREINDIERLVNQ